MKKKSVFDVSKNGHFQIRIISCLQKMSLPSCKSQALRPHNQESPLKVILILPFFLCKSVQTQGICFIMSASFLFIAPSLTAWGGV